MRLLTPLLIVCLFTVGHASIQTRSIRGTVVDPAGTALPGVSVELRKSDAVERRTITDAAGAWSFENVPAGDYKVRLALSGFVTTDVIVRVGATAPAPLRTVLKVGAISEVVEVLAEKALVETQRGAGRGVVGGAPADVAGGAAGGIPAAPPPPPAPFTGWTSHPRVTRSGVPVDTASYARIEENRFRSVSEHPLSTFSIDVDTASYANVRRFLNMGVLPPADAVRIEELINYFRFDYPDPPRDAPVSVTADVSSAPWNSKHKLALVGIRSAAVKQEHAPPRNLTFLLDVSGSMAPPARLPLVKTAMQLLVDTLRPEDKVAIVVYASGTGLALPTTSGERKAAIKQAIEELHAGGSTNGAAGIQLAYDIASANFIKGGVNRVILATDGDFNVGITSREDLLRLIEEKRERGMSANLGFAAAVAEFGMLLRRSPFKGNASWPQALTLAREHRGRDDDGYRAEFIRLVELAAALENRRTPPETDLGR